MDILFYSNYCKHCEKIKQFIVKSNLTDKISAICIDKRTKDPRTGQIVVVLENGKQTTLPPNVHSVPSILIKSNFHVISGDEIIKYFQPTVELQQKNAVGHLGEPSGFDLVNSSISDQYTFYSDGSGQNKTSFVNSDHNIAPIHAEPDNYRPNKLSPDVTIDKLHNYRTEDIKKLNNDDMNSMIQQMTENRHQDLSQISNGAKVGP